MKSFQSTIVAMLLALNSGMASAAFFEDEEARQAILDLRQKVETIRQSTETLRQSTETLRQSTEAIRSSGARDIASRGGLVPVQTQFARSASAT